MRFAEARLSAFQKSSQFHQVAVNRRGSGLDDENILATHVFLDLGGEILAIGELSDLGIRQRLIEPMARSPARGRGERCQ